MIYVTVLNIGCYAGRRLGRLAARIRTSVLRGYASLSLLAGIVLWGCPITEFIPREARLRVEQASSAECFPYAKLGPVRTELVFVRDLGERRKIGPSFDEVFYLRFGQPSEFHGGSDGISKNNL